MVGLAAAGKEEVALVEGVMVAVGQEAEAPVAVLAAGVGPSDALQGWQVVYRAAVEEVTAVADLAAGGWVAVAEEAEGSAVVAMEGVAVEWEAMAGPTAVH